MMMNDVSKGPTRPVLRYHGGKWMLAPWIIGHLPPHRRYVEPFGGAMSVLMRKARSHSEIYNDLDEEIVNLFRVLRERGQELQKALRLTPFARAEFEESCEGAEDAVEAARRLVVRSFMGFGSNAATRRSSTGKARCGFRGISDRSGATPAHDWMNYPAAMESMIERLRGVVIENRPALEVIERYDAEEVVFYVDPPYVADTRDMGADYRHEMTDEDHEALAACLHGVKGKVVLSGYHSRIYDELYQSWHRVERAAFADGARKRVEVLWMNFQPEGQLL